MMMTILLNILPNMPMTFYDRILDKWGDDLFDWTRYHAPKVIFILLLSALLILLLRTLANKATRYSQKHQGELPVSGLRSQQLRTLASVINSVGSFIVMFVAMLQILPTFGINVGPLLASAGIAGLAIGFGAQALVKDVINGFFIVADNQYDIGDLVKIAGVQGTVEDLSLRQTILRDSSGAVHFVPNSEIKIVTNLTRDWAQLEVRTVVDISEPAERVIALLRQIATEMWKEKIWTEQIVAEPEVPGIEKIAGGDVEYLVVTRTRPGKQHAVGRELRRRIKESFAKANIKTPGPRVFTFEQKD